MGVSRKCVKTWIDRYAAEGEAGLRDRSSRPHTMPTADQRPRSSSRSWRCAGASVAARTGSAPSSACRPGRCRGSCAATGCPRLARADPITGEVIRASKATAVRYERDRPGELVHMDVKKLGRIPDGGGWRAHGRGTGRPPRPQPTKVGFDYVHSLVDDHSRLAYSEVLPDEKGPTCAAFLTRAVGYFAAHGITRIERLMTDNAWAYRCSLREVCAAARHPADVHPAPLPLAERQGRTPQPDPAHRMGLPAGLHHQRPSAPPPLRPGSSTTTLNDATAHSAASHRSADCYQPDGRVHLGRVMYWWPRR